MGPTGGINRTRGRKGRRTVRYGIASLVMAGVLLSPTVAGAEEAESDTQTERGEHIDHWAKHRLDRMCHRVPRVERRTERMLERIHGDESVRGSLAWLDAKAAQARDNGYQDLASVVESRRNIRAAAVPYLEVRQVELANIHAICADHGIPL